MLVSSHGFFNTVVAEPLRKRMECTKRLWPFALVAVAAMACSGILAC